MGEKLFALMTFYVDLRYTFETSDVCECEVVRVLSYSLSDGDKEVFEP